MRIYIVVCFNWRHDLDEVQAFDTIDKAIAYGENGKPWASVMWDDYQIFERSVT